MVKVGHRDLDRFIKFMVKVSHRDLDSDYTALLWQKEASDKSGIFL